MVLNLGYLSPPRQGDWLVVHDLQTPNHTQRANVQRRGCKLVQFAAGQAQANVETIWEAGSGLSNEKLAESHVYTCGGSTSACWYSYRLLPIWMLHVARGGVGCDYGSMPRLSHITHHVHDSRPWALVGKRGTHGCHHLHHVPTRLHNDVPRICTTKDFGVQLARRKPRTVQGFRRTQYVHLLRNSAVSFAYSALTGPPSVANSNWIWASSGLTSSPRIRYGGRTENSMSVAIVYCASGFMQLYNKRCCRG